MTDESPDVWPQSLWCGAQRHFAFQSRAWKSRGDQRATRTPLSPRPFSLEQVQALLRAAMRSPHPTRDVALLCLFLETGIRMSELAELTWQDFRLEQPVSFVWVFGPKDRFPRRLPVSALLRHVLLRYKAAAQEMPALPTQADAHQVRAFDLVQHEPLLQNQPGRSQQKLAISELLKRLAYDGGIDFKAGSIAHRLRATWLQACVSKRPGDLVSLAALLEISLLETEMRYQLANTAGMEVFRQELRAFAERVGGFDPDRAP